MKNHESDDYVLNGDEEVLAVGGEREAAAPRVGEGDGVGCSLENLQGSALDISSRFSKRT